MTCAELESLICDYVDGGLSGEAKAIVQQHLAVCRNCAEMVRDASAAVAFIDRAAAVEPPPELMTSLLFHAPWRQNRTAASGVRQWFRRLAHPVLQPRFAMGMAMTILSFAMLARFVAPAHKLRPEDLSPTRVWTGVEDHVYRGWQRTVKFYESLKVVYQMQSKLRDWQQQQEQDSKAATGTPDRNAAQHRLPVKNSGDTKSQ